MFQEYRLQEPDCAGYLQTVAVNVSKSLVIVKDQGKQ